MNFYLHIGYPKALSTLNQKIIFNKLNDCYYFGTPFNENLNSIFKDISLLSEKAFQKKKNYLIKNFNKEKKNIDKKKIIISFEGFLYCLIYHSKKKPNRYNIYRTLKRLNSFLSLFGKVKILVIIRKHSKILESFFSEFAIDIKFSINEKDIENILLNKPSKYSFILDSFKYGKLYNYLKKISKNPKFIFYEDFIFNKKKYFKDLSSFFDQKNKIKVNSNIRVINSKKDKENYFNYILHFIKYYKIPTLYNLWKFKFTLSKYINELELIKRVFFPNKIRLINLNKYDALIKDYYVKDLNKLPKNNNKFLKKYNYF